MFFEILFVVLAFFGASWPQPKHESLGESWHLDNSIIFEEESLIYKKAPTPWIKIAKKSNY